MSRFDASRIRKVLIIRLGGLGDLALCSAIIDDLVKAMPQAEFHLHTEPPWRQLFSNDPRLSQIFDYPIRKQPWLEGARWWVRLLAGEHYDLIVDLQCNDRSWLLLAVAKILGKAPRWVVSRKSGFPYSFRNRPHSTNVPAIQLLRMPLALLGIAANADCPVLFSHRDDIEAVAGMLSPLGGDSFGVLVPGCSAARADKRWGVANYVAMGAQWLATGRIRHIVILGGADEADVCQQVADGIGAAVLNLCGKTSLTQILPVVEAACGVVSNDTGIAHIVAAARVPMVVICGPTLATRTKPLGEHVKALQIDPDCFREHSVEVCMARLAPDQVLQELLGIDSAIQMISR